MTDSATTLPGGMVEVTQADRDAAAAWFEQAQRDGVIRKGHPRDYPLAEAFARHRLAATRPAAATDAGVCVPVEMLREWYTASFAAWIEIMGEQDDAGPTPQHMAEMEALLTNPATLSQPKAGGEVERLREALDRYGKHDGLCGIVGGYGYCTCGLDAALAASTKGEG